MARIRTIKPEFWSDEELSALPEATHMLAGALLNHADDYGYFNANPALVKAACSPIREPSVSIPESLRRLHAEGFIRLGTAPDGKRYGHVIKFDEHQRVSHPTQSKISRLSITWDELQNPPENFAKPPESFRPEQGTGKGKEQGKEKEISGSPNGDHDNPEKETTKADRLSQVTIEAIASFNAILGKPAGQLASVQLANDVRQTQVKRCLKTAREICEKQYGSAKITAQFWQDYFAECDRDPFKRGDGPYSGTHANWRPDFEYLTRNDVMTALFDKAMAA